MNAVSDRSHRSSPLTQVKTKHELDPVAVQVRMVFRAEQSRAAYGWAGGRSFVKLLKGGARLVNRLMKNLRWGVAWLEGLSLCEPLKGGVPLAPSR